MTASVKDTLTIDEAVARFSRLFTRAKRQHAAKLRREHKFKRKEIKK